MPTILIADDSNTEVHAYSKMLQKHGFDVVVANDGETAVIAASEHHPDLILMDIVMPGIDGFQATRKITRNPDTSDIPIIIISTKAQQTDKIWGIRQGARDYLIKPVSENTLIAKIKSILHKPEPQ